MQSHVQWLRHHLLRDHSEGFDEALGESVKRSEYFGGYQEVCKEKDRLGIPEEGLCVDRRTPMRLREEYREVSVKTLLCVLCAEKKTFRRG